MSTSTSGILILAMVLSIIAEPVFAQKTVTHRYVEIGAGPSMVAIYDNDPQLEPVPEISYAADIGFGYLMTRNLSFTTHLMYERKGGTRLRVPAGIESPEVRYTTSASYVTYVVGFRTYLGNSNIFLEGGPFMSFAFDTKTYLVVDGAKALIPNDFATIDLGVSGSVGLTPLRKELQGLTFRLVNNLGLSDANIETGAKELTNALSFIMAMRFQTRHRPYR